MYKKQKTLVLSALILFMCSIMAVFINVTIASMLILLTILSCCLIGLIRSINREDDELYVTISIAHYSDILIIYKILRKYVSNYSSTASLRQISNVAYLRRTTIYKGDCISCEKLASKIKSKCQTCDVIVEDVPTDHDYSKNITSKPALRRII